MRAVIEKEPTFTRAVLSGGGALDHLSAGLVREEITGQLTPDSLLLLRLEGVTSIDSAGVGTLVAILRAVRKTNGRMALVGVRPLVRSVLEIIRLTTVFEIFTTEDEACRALTPAHPGS